MVIAGTINRVAFYCRVNHRDRDYEKYLDDVMRCLEEVQLWNFLLFGIYWGYAIYIYADVCVLFVWNFCGT